ncbi:LLM class flavin-dependent oxidoreductase [Actinomadura madurae]|uniref:LLM class flavin-dependent oxidoreductase n=1 Tax=Actinomadura madurae TaxID=1993 RepID=UPI0020D217AA|nr:LLM class flavin-dependent oxidoreductase [Actinomadura madurae]MCP9950927.1 LLM class flavin-dependent oxidoreductase [Actinomadura madurae]
MPTTVTGKRSPFEIGFMTFAEITADPDTGTLPSAHQRARETIEQARLADEAGLDLFAVGEHHRTDFVGSAPAVVLAAAAQATTNIRLTSAVTVLSSDDPVRVWEQFATLDQISGGRAEIIAGRGSYTESFPSSGTTWPTTPTCTARSSTCCCESARRTRSPGTDGSAPHWAPPTSVPARCRKSCRSGSASEEPPPPPSAPGRLGLPMAMALLLGPITSHQQTIDLYREAARQAGHDPAALRTSINLHGYVGRTSQGARDTMYPYFAEGMMANNHQRGRGFAMPRAAFEAQTSPNAGLVVGSPQEVIEKLLAYHELYGLDRALIQIGFGGMPQKDVLEAIELLGTEVAPVVRREVGSRKEQAA